MGDLFLTRSSPAMDNGSVKRAGLTHSTRYWICPWMQSFPGHFEFGRQAGIATLSRLPELDLYRQVQAMRDKGATVEAVRRNIHMDKYSDFRQYPNYEATFADNAEAIYRQLQQ